MKYFYLFSLLVFASSCVTKSKSAAYSGYSDMQESANINAGLLSKISLGNVSVPLSNSPKTSEYLQVTESDKIDQKEDQNRVVIYNANLRVEIKSPDSCNSQLEKIAEQHGGYVVSLGNRRSVIRVKAENLNKAIGDVSQLGKVQNKTIYGEDVTESFIDNQIRLENAKNARKRYLELLEKAENVEAALKVEIELERLNGQIDLYEGTLRKLTHLSDYSTLTVDLEEKVKPGILGYVGIGIWGGMRWLFVRS